MVAIAATVALSIGSAALTLGPPLTGRLHPGLVPGVLTLTLLVAAIVVMRERQVSPADSPSLRGALAAALAVLILAFGVGMFGIFAAAFVSATVAASGVAGMTPRRAVSVGLGLSAGLSVLFTLFRQPLPILSPGLPW